MHFRILREKSSNEPIKQSPQLENRKYKKYNRKVNSFDARFMSIETILRQIESQSESQSEKNETGSIPFDDFIIAIIADSLSKFFRNANSVRMLKTIVC